MESKGLLVKRTGGGRGLCSVNRLILNVMDCMYMSWKVNEGHGVDLSEKSPWKY